MSSATMSRLCSLVVYFLVIVVLAFPPKIEFTDARQSVKMSETHAERKEWRESILKGIVVLPKVGDPGRIVVFGKHAEPILTGKDAEDVLVAAAELGKGRIVAISHADYSAKFSSGDKNPVGALKAFYDNLKKWLTKSTFKKNDGIIDATDNVNKETLKSSKIVLYHGGIVKINTADLTEFVRNGGALLYCMTPKKWKQLSDTPYASLLNDAGICYASGDNSVRDTGFPVKDNKASHAHLLRVLDEAGKSFNKAVDQMNMLNRLKYIPANVFLKLKFFVEKLWDTCRRELKNSTIPSPKNQISNKRDRAILNIWLLCHDMLQQQNIKAPGVNLFPGDFSAEPALKSNTLKFHSDIGDYHSTACYLPAGQTLKVEVLSGNNDSNWQIMIGCHTDDVNQREKLRRWPRVNKKIVLNKKSLQLSTPFGGLIYLMSPNKQNQGISVKLENVVDSPRLRLTDGERGEKAWNKSRHSPGLWADIEGELLTITMPASRVREMDFYSLTFVMQTWDSVVRLYHDLRGTNASKFRRMWIVTDEQPSAGLMHSGYPIVTHLDVADPKRSGFLLNGSALQTKGNWGVFHEIGHNMQRNEWTLQGTREITANIFTLYAMDQICHMKNPWIHKWLQSKLSITERFLKGDAGFEKWKRSEGIGLFVYAQLAHEFGWESYRKVFRRYEAMVQREKPKTDRKKIDKWFSIFSEIVGFNLSPLATFWNIPVSNETLAKLKTAFPVGFLPADEITRFAPDRVDAVLKKFRGTVGRRYFAADSVV